MPMNRYVSLGILFAAIGVLTLLGAVSLFPLAVVNIVLGILVVGLGTVYGAVS